MKISRSGLTLILAVFMTGVELITVTFDGGNVDFYQKPLVIVWFIFTLAAMAPKFRAPLLIFIRRAWWLQALMPVLIYCASILLVGIYKPYNL